jgi:RNA ligase (TIGR02306 family)
VKKGQFSVGDFCIYIEIDSMIPKAIWSEFLWKEGNTKEKYRLKTCKMKGQISQGLILPINVFSLEHLGGRNEGEDVTELLGIEKYVPYIPVHLQGEVVGEFPSFIPKTDETRIQSEPWILEKMRGKLIHVSEKIDGTSGTFFLKDDCFGVCSRNIELKENENNLYWKIAKQYNIEFKLRQLKQKLLGLEFAIQGEIIGQGIQGNKYKLENNKFYVFNVYNIWGQRYLSYADMKHFCKSLELDIVPFIKSDKLLGSVDDWILISQDNSVLYNKTPREGIVVRGIEEEIISNYGRFSFKVINPEFLLKYGE